MRATSAFLALSLVLASGCDRGERAADPGSVAAAADTGAPRPAEPAETVVLASDSIGGDEPGLECFDAPRHFVVARERVDDVGTDFLIRPRGSAAARPPCIWAPDAATWELPNETAEYLLAVRGDLLILDSGTAPDPRGLIVWDLAQRRRLLQDTYSGPIEVRWEYAQFWQESGAATRQNCPQLERLRDQGLGAALEQRARLDFATMRIERLDETRCAPRQ
jgi:hypothetical protein